MAHNATLFSVPFDSRDLYECEDRDYLVWLGVLIDKVRESREAANA